MFYSFCADIYIYINVYLCIHRLYIYIYTYMHIEYTHIYIHIYIYIFIILYYYIILYYIILYYIIVYCIILYYITLYIHIYIYICIIYKCNVYVCIYIYMYNLIWSIYWQKPFAILVTNTWRNLRSGPGASGWTLQQQASQGWVFFHLGPGLTWPQGLSMFTLWLCQNSYWKLWFIVDFTMKNGDFP